MAHRYHIYKENELFNAVPYIKILSGKDYDPSTNIFAQIDKVAHLVEAAISRKYSILTFVGEISGEPLTITVSFDQSKRDTQLIVTAEIAGYKKSVSDGSHLLYIGFENFMNWVKSVVAFERGLEIPEGVDVPLGLWVTSEAGKRFVAEMVELGFTSQLNSKYGYDTPFDSRGGDSLRVLDYCEYIGHFRESIPYDRNYDEYRLQVRSFPKGPEPKFYLNDNEAIRKLTQMGFKYDKKLVAEWDESNRRKPVHEYGMSPAEFLDTMKRLVKFNVERLDAISEAHGGLTWRGIRFDKGHDRFDKPDDFAKLPKAEQDRIERTIAEQKELRKKEFDKFFMASKFAKIYEYAKQHGEVTPDEHQYDNEHAVDYKFPVELDVPDKDGNIIKTTIEVRGRIWVSGELYSCYAWRSENFYPESFSFYVPIEYSTEKGSFISWAEAKKAGSDLRWGCNCSINKTGKKPSLSSIVINPYYDKSRTVSPDDIARVENVMFNISRDHKQYLVDCKLIKE